MNSRDKLFFKNVTLHKSVSYRKKEEKEEVDKMRDKYMKELMKKQEEKSKKIQRHNSLIHKLLRCISLH